MANTYKGAVQKLTASTTTSVYTCPSSTISVVNLITICNIDSSNSDTIEISIDRSGTVYYINKGASIVATTTLTISGPIVLQAGDILKFKAATANRLDVTVSLLEIT